MRALSILPAAILGAALLGSCAPVNGPDPVTEPSGSVMDPAVRLESYSPPAVEDPIRVGLETDVQSIRFPRNEAGWVLWTEGGRARITERGFAIEAPVEGAAVRWTIQVASMAGERSARELEEQLIREGASSTRVGFDGETGLYRVYAGDFATDQAAREARQVLVDAGYPRDMFVTKRSSTTEVPKQLTVVDDEGTRWLAPAGEVWVLGQGESMPLVGGKTYRGAVIVRANDRGLLNVINRLGLEDYVRGVVPNELGPRVYDQIAALEAQAIAARTYAISRMGDFRDEGFDICATPACQVYGGHSTEHPMSDEAVRNTAGMIAVYGGEPIDALYTSTCGGHTSDVDVMFPGRSEPYLRGVDCVELDFLEMKGVESSGVLDLMEVRARAFRQMASIREDARYNNRAVVSSAEAAANLAGFELKASLLPQSVSRRDVLTYLGSAFDLRAAAARLLMPEDLRYFFPSVENPSDAHWTAAYINKFLQRPSQPLDGVDLSAALERDELHALMFSWLERQGAVQESRGKVESFTGGNLETEFEAQTSRWQISAGTPVLRELSDRYRAVASVQFLRGDRVRLIHDRAGRLATVIVEVNYDGAAFDRTSSFSSWVRSYTASQLTESINRRRPITSLQRLEIAEIDPYGRVRRMLVTDRNGASFELAGLPVRWGLSVPDNLFFMQESRDAGGELRYTFYGKGWGHGTGMCQVGAYGMAFAGKSSTEIIEHYYTGARVTRWK